MFNLGIATLVLASASPRRADLLRAAGMGQDILASPIDRGFNRLAWLLPYATAAAALVAIVFTARRWSRPAVHAVAGDPGMDSALSARLDDELRDLD